VAGSSSLDQLTATRRLGEVIETSTTTFVAESDQLHCLPGLGTLVRVGGLNQSQSFFGVVAYGATGGLDTSRRAVRRGGDELADAAIYDRHPELELILRTVFSVAVVGYREGAAIRHSLPALPVPLHYSVHTCTLEEVGAFCHAPHYFPTLLNYRGDLTPEQLVASHLHWIDATLADDHTWLTDASRRLARLMKHDYDRLVTILQSVDPG
jgi:hypothetical protein